jgi:hypothetical protein
LNEPIAQSLLMLMSLLQSIPSNLKHLIAILLNEPSIAQSLLNVNEPIAQSLLLLN